MNTNAETYMYYLKITILPMVIFALLGLVIWQWKISLIEEKQKKEVTEIISNIIQEQAKNDLLLPKYVFINTDSSSTKELNNKLIKQIADLLTSKYLADDRTKLNDIELKPFFVLPKSDKKGNYILTETQLNELKYHIDFLAKQVDLEVDKTKEEVGRDIDRLNNWVTIWIGVIGFLGIFIPIIINIDTSKSAEKATEKSAEALNKANEAIDIITTAQSNIDKIEVLETKVNDAESKINDITPKTDEAKKNATEAFGKAETALSKSKETENVLTAMSAIGNLKDIDANTLQYINNPLEVVTKTLYSIYLGLLNCNNQIDNTIVKDCLRQLGVKLQLLTFYKFMKREQTSLINTYSKSISEKLNDGYDETKFHQILSELKILAESLNKME